MIYWLTTNLWTTGQGLVTRRLMPRPAAPPKRSSRTPPKDEPPPTNASRRRIPTARRARARLGRAAARQAKGRGTDTAMSSSGVVTVEATGETVGEAKWAALRELEQQVPGLDRERVQFQVVSEGERGLLGVGFTPGPRHRERRRSFRREPAGDESAAVREAREFVERIAAGIGADVTVTAREHRGRGAGELRGPRRRTLHRQARPDDRCDPVPRERDDARGGRATRVVVDAAGYRARRTATLENLARRTASARIGHRPPRRDGADDPGRAEDRPRGAQGRSRRSRRRARAPSRTASWSSSHASSRPD